MTLCMPQKDMGIGIKNSGYDVDAMERLMLIPCLLCFWGPSF